MSRKKLSSVLVGIFCLAIILFSRLVFGLNVAFGPSMEPVISDGDHLAVWRLCSDYQRGDIVIAYVDGKEVCKRIAAGPYDSIRIDETGITVNGIHVSDSTAAYKGKVLKHILKADEYFLLGDNYEVSHDSRDYGPVSSKALNGKVIRIF